MLFWPVNSCARSLELSAALGQNTWRHLSEGCHSRRMIVCWDQYCAGEQMATECLKLTCAGAGDLRLGYVSASAVSYATDTGGQGPKRSHRISAECLWVYSVIKVRKDDIYTECWGARTIVVILTSHPQLLGSHRKAVLSAQVVGVLDAHYRRRSLANRA